jgi:uncharacterized protein
VIFLTILSAVVMIAVLLYAGEHSKSHYPELSGSLEVNRRLAYQLWLLPVTVLSLMVTFLLNPVNFPAFFSLGSIDAPASALPFFGIAEGDGWLGTGVWLCIVISVVTAAYMALQLRRSNTPFSMPQGVVWVLLISLTNSFGEEMICRIGLVAPLKGLLEPVAIFWISGIVFGLAHIRGVPSGAAGVVLAGLLGFVLAKSLYETGGFFWALAIHFLQDVIIFGGLFMISHAESAEEAGLLVR